MSLYVVGGQQKYLLPLFADKEKWYEYHKGIVIKIDPDSGRSEIVVEHATGENLPTLFKAATVDDGNLYICTDSEVLIYSLPQFHLTGRVSLPYFNDVHHVRPSKDGNLLVVSTGLEMVCEVSHEGEAIRFWNVLGEDPWTKFSRDTDYRRLSTKPHQSHPNFVFYLDEEIWVTRFHQKDAICLTRPRPSINIEIGSPHDGLVEADHIYFTTVNGFIVVVGRESLSVERVIDLNRIHNYGAPLGWCRGLFVEDGKVWVGFSRIRPTKIRENIEWAKRSIKEKIIGLLPEKFQADSRWKKGGLKKKLPTHLACYDLRTLECLCEVNMEPSGLSAIFSIFSSRSLQKGMQKMVQDSQDFQEPVRA